MAEQETSTDTFDLTPEDEPGDSLTLMQRISGSVTYEVKPDGEVDYNVKPNEELPSGACTLAAAHGLQALDAILQPSTQKGPMEDSLQEVAADLRNVLLAVRQNDLDFAAFYVNEWAVGMLGDGVPEAGLLNKYICHSGLPLFNHDAGTGSATEAMLSGLEEHLHKDCTPYLGDEVMGSLNFLVHATKAACRCVHNKHLPENGAVDRRAAVQAYSTDLGTKRNKTLPSQAHSAEMLYKVKEPEVHPRLLEILETRTQDTVLKGMLLATEAKFFVMNATESEIKEAQRKTEILEWILDHRYRLTYLEAVNPGAMSLIGMFLDVAARQNEYEEVEKRILYGQLQDAKGSVKQARYIQDSANRAKHPFQMHNVSTVKLAGTAPNGGMGRILTSYSRDLFRDAFCPAEIDKTLDDMYSDDVTTGCISTKPLGFKRIITPPCISLDQCLLCGTSADACRHSFLDAVTTECDRKSSMYSGVVCKAQARVLYMSSLLLDIEDNHKASWCSSRCAKAATSFNTSVFDVLDNSF